MSFVYLFKADASLSGCMSEDGEFKIRLDISNRNELVRGIELSAEERGL